MIFRKSTESEIATLVKISKEAFDSDVTVGATEPGGPPDYDSVEWHKEMLKDGRVFTLAKDDGEIVGGAILFEDEIGIIVGRIFVEPKHFRCGYGLALMSEIENYFSGSKSFRLDTPIWNVRTSSFYNKCGYEEVDRDEEFVYFLKTIE